MSILQKLSLFFIGLFQSTYPAQPPAGLVPSPPQGAKPPRSRYVLSDDSIERIRASEYLIIEEWSSGEWWVLTQFGEHGNPVTTKKSRAVLFSSVPQARRSMRRYNPDVQFIVRGFPRG